MPKPSCSRPAHRSRQHIANTSAHTYKAGSASSGTRPRKRAGAPVLGRDPNEPGAIPAVAGDGDDEVGVRAGETAGRPQHRVEALAGHESAEAEYEPGLLGKAVLPAGVGSGRGLERAEPVDVDARGDHHRRQ